jgi:hypothetical protein
MFSYSKLTSLRERKEAQIVPFEGNRKKSWDISIALGKQSSSIIVSQAISFSSGVTEKNIGKIWKRRKESSGPNINIHKGDE